MTRLETKLDRVLTKQEELADIAELQSIRALRQSVEQLRQLRQDVERGGDS